MFGFVVRMDLSLHRAAEIGDAMTLQRLLCSGSYDIEEPDKQKYWVCVGLKKECVTGSEREKRG